MSDQEAAVQQMDAELQSLLGELQQETDEPQEETVDDGILSDPAPADAGNVTVPEPVLSDPATDMEAQEPPNLPIPSTPSNLADIKAVVEKFDHDYSEVQTNLKRDRKRIDSVIDLLLVRVQANADAETDTMSLVKALAVLADTNGHAVKLLDSRSKLLAATKSSVTAAQANVTISGVDPELQKVLDQPPAEDE